MPMNWELTEGIRNFFWSNLTKMPLSYQWHYCERLYRITGNKKYTKPINEYALSQIVHITKLIEALNDQEVQSDFGLKFIQKYRKSTVPRIRNRVPIYEKNLSFIFYQELLFLLNKLQDYKLENSLENNIYSQAILKLRSANLENYFANTQLITVDPVQTVNMAFHIKKLQIADIPTYLIIQTNKLFENIANKEQYQNKLYYLTHIILSESYYYQRLLPDNTYDWIFRYFDQEMSNILKTPNDDLLLEIGICYKLAQKENAELNAYLINILQQTQSSIPPILLRSDVPFHENTIQKFEHRNVLAIIYSSALKKLYPGPQIII